MKQIIKLIYICKTARQFLCAIDPNSNTRYIKDDTHIRILIFYSQIISIFSTNMKFIQVSESYTSPGWIDFNDTSIGLTSTLDNEEAYTEIRYLSITDWYFKGMNT